MNALKGYSLIKAWRIYRGKTQSELAAAMGITQGAFSQIEKSARNQTETLRRGGIFFEKKQPVPSGPAVLILFVVVAVVAEFHHRSSQRTWFLPWALACAPRPKREEKHGK
ncbi:MAG: helix-turn-helix transcriptional regulator [Victivallales bacterium]|nr:helix-turn-helix transcriptional regulator [Victivallales bacterium]